MHFYQGTQAARGNVDTAAEEHEAHHQASQRVQEGVAERRASDAAHRYQRRHGVAILNRVVEGRMAEFDC